MNEQLLLEKIRRLPPDKRDAVERFVDRVEGQQKNVQQRKPLAGALSHLGMHITEEDIDDARREMWRNFPRVDV